MILVALGVAFMFFKLIHRLAWGPEPRIGQGDTIDGLLYPEEKTK